LPRRLSCGENSAMPNPVRSTPPIAEERARPRTRRKPAISVPTSVRCLRNTSGTECTPAQKHVTYARTHERPHPHTHARRHVHTCTDTPGVGACASSRVRRHREGCGSAHGAPVGCRGYAGQMHALEALRTHGCGQSLLSGTNGSWLSVWPCTNLRRFRISGHSTA
jgi:hypothetical protein